jgi:NADP-dependent alcohol dehydrogenase
MLNFTFYNPVKILFGKGQIAELSKEMAKNKRILMTYGGGSIKRNGVYDQVMDALKGYDVLEFSGIEPNPHYETLMKAVDIVKKEKIDFLLSVGGGSVLDGTKFIAAAAEYEGDDPWDILSDWSLIKRAIPFGAVLTLPATGSEMNAGAVITKAETQDKLNFVHPAVFPKFSILDPTVTFTLPPHQTANGIIDTFVHTTEQYLTYPVNAPFQDRIAEGILLALIEDAPIVMTKPDDYDARANIMLCAAMALNGLLGMGVPQDWAAHMIGHEITAKYGLDHGQTLAIISPSVLQVKRDSKREKLLQYAERVWDIKEGDDESRIDKAINKMREFFEGLGVKTHFSDYDISEDVVPVILEQLKKHGMTALGENQDITLEVSKEILQRSL